MNNVVQLDQYRQEPVEADAVDWASLHSDLCAKFEESEDAGRTNVQKAERDVDYYDGKQWTEDEVKKLRKRGQAALMDNVIKPKIRSLQGLEKAKRTQPKAQPRTPQHEKDAYSCTDALRFVCDYNKFNQVRSKVAKDIFSAGWGGYEVTVEQKPGRRNPVIIVRRCPWDRMGADPHSAEDTYEDAGYRFLVRWMDRDDAIAEYGEAAGKVFDETVSFGRAGGAFDDKPKTTTWVAYNKRWRVRVVQIYFRHADQGICFAEFTKGGLLNYGQSPWLDEYGEPEDPYVWGSANVDRDNNRYGEIRHMIDLQDGINHRTSKFQHLISVRQTYRTASALGPQSPLEMRRQLAKADGDVVLADGIEFGKQFGVIPTTDMADRQFELLQAHRQSIMAQGPNASLQGKGPASASGRAILANQQAGANEAEPVYEVIHEMDLGLYRKIWNRIRQFWTAEDWIRVTDDPETVRWVGINVPMVDEASGMPMVDPRTGQPMIQNQLSMLDVDLILEDAPLAGTMQDEEFGKMVELAHVVPSLQQLPANAWIEASNLRNKSKINRIIEKASQPDPMKLKAAESELANKDADTANKQASAMKNEAQARSTLADIGFQIMDQGQQLMQPGPQPTSPAPQPGF